MIINKIINLFNKKADTNAILKDNYVEVPLKTNIEENKFYNLINTPFIKNLLNTNSLYVTVPCIDTDEVIGIIKKIKYNYIEVEPETDKYIDILKRSEIHIDGLYKNDKLYKITSFYIEPIIDEIDIQKFII